MGRRAIRGRHEGQIRLRAHTPRGDLGLRLPRDPGDLGCLWAQIATTASMRACTLLRQDLSRQNAGREIHIREDRPNATPRTPCRDAETAANYKPRSCRQRMFCTRANHSRWRESGPKELPKPPFFPPDTTCALYLRVSGSAQTLPPVLLLRRPRKNPTTRPPTA